MSHTTDVTIRMSGYQKTGERLQLWSAYLGSELIVDRAVEPNFKACRVLADRDFTGVLRFFHDGKTEPSFIIKDIQKGAKLTVRENRRHGPRFAKYAPHPNEEA